MREKLLNYKSPWFLLLAMVTWIQAALPSNVTLKPFYDTTVIKTTGEKNKWMGEVPGLVRHFYVLDMRGYIRALYPTDDQATGYTKKTLLDFHDKVQFHLGAEYGAFALAFHPNFQANGKLYLLYMGKPADGNLPGAPGDWTPPGGIHILEEWKAEGDKRDQLTFQRTIWTYPHPRSYGVPTMVFGPEGKLFISNMDLRANARDSTMAGGKILRIDIDHKDAGKEYAIPTDNPYYPSTDPKVVKEIWTSGFRQAWTLSYDPLTQKIWAGDVGHNDNEEINLIKPGRQYGWKQGSNGETIPINGFNGPCSNSVDKTHCQDFEDPAYAFDWLTWGKQDGVMGIKCINGGMVFRGDPSSPFYGYLIADDVATDRLLAFKPGEEPQIIGDLVDFDNRHDHYGLIHVTSDSYGSLYGLFIGDPNYQIYKFSHPDLTPLTVPVNLFTGRPQANKKTGPRMIVNLGHEVDDLHSAPGTLRTGRIFSVDGQSRQTSDRNALPVGLYLVK